jgi:hypothetical protein
MNIPVSPGEKYALIALDVATDLKGTIDLGDDLLALQGEGLHLPNHWREWLGSIESDRIERYGLILLAKRTSQRPTVDDDENQQLQYRTNWLFWSLLALHRMWMVEGGIQLTGAHVNGEVSVRQKRDMPSVITLPGLRPSPIGESQLRRAAGLSANLQDLMATQPRMRRVKLALQTFWVAFGEPNLGQRIHQFVRVVSDGFAKAFGADDFRRKCNAFVKDARVVRRQLYQMRNNAEQFNQPDRRLPRLSVRRSLERAYLRAHQAEALARHCVARFVENRRLWPQFRDEARVDAFWKKPQKDWVASWGAPLDLKAAVAGFDARFVPDET